MNPEENKKNEPIIEEGSTIFTQRVKTEQKVKTKGKNKGAKQLIALLLVVFLLGGGIFAAQKGGWFEDKLPEKIAEKQKINLNPNKFNESAGFVKKSGVTSINIKNPSGEYSIVPFKDKDGNRNYKLKGYDNIDQNHEMIIGVVDFAYDVKAYEKLDDEYSEKDCGLDKPVITVEVEGKEGKEFSFYFGDTVPGDNGYYLKTSFADGIYLVETDHYTRFSYEKTDYIQTNLMNAWMSEGENDIYFDDSTQTIIRYDNIKISGAGLKKDIELIYDTESKSAQVYLMKSPAHTYADSDKINTLLKPFNDGFVAADAYVFNPTQNDLEEYGLADPFRVVEYEIRGEKVTIKVGKGPDFDEGYYSLLFNDNDVIYKYTASQSEFLSWTDKDLRAELLFLRDISDVETLTYKLQGQEEYVYEIDVFEDEKGDANPVYTVTRNSKKLDDESFRNLYGEICLVKADDYMEDISSLTGTPYITLTYEYNEGSDDEVITFQKYNDRYYRFSINGIGDELIDYQTVDSIVEHFADFNAGKTVAAPY